MPKTSKQKKSTSAEKKSKFDYKKFAENLIAYKNKKGFSYVDIAHETGISLSVIALICAKKYNSDLTLNKAQTLANWMQDDICNYIKLK